MISTANPHSARANLNELKLESKQILPFTSKFQVHHPHFNNYFDPDLYKP